MSAFRGNLVANYLGKGWAALVSLAFIPVYLRYLGVEAYGLVGVQASLVALLSLLDFGLSSAVTREFAALQVQTGASAKQRDLLRTLEPVYWGMGVLAGAIVALLATPIARHWVNPGTLSTQSVTQAILLIGLTIAAQWPIALYNGGLNGLERQVPQNALAATVATVRALGAVAVLAWVAPTIQAFFVWQALCSAAHALAAAFLLWRYLPRGAAPAQFRSALLRRLLPMALGMAGIAASSAVLTQLDKVILSRLLPLEQFGYYTLAATAAGVLFHLVMPVFTAAFPRLSRLAAQQDRAGLRSAYSQATQVMAATVLPVAATLVCFAGIILRLWTGDQAIAAAAALPLALLAAGNAINALVNPPFALRLATGSLRPVVILNIVATLLMAPLAWILVDRFGMAGGASAWVVINLLYLLVGVPFMHAGILPRETPRWLLRDVLPPLAAASLTAALGAWMLPAEFPRLAQIIWIVTVGLLASAGAVLASSTGRGFVLRTLLPKGG